MNDLKLNLKKYNFSKVKFMNTKKIALTFVLCFFVSFLRAQVGAIESQITTWGDTITTVLNAAVGIFALVGGFLIFIQYMQGNQDAQKNFVRFVIGLAIFGLVALIANVFLPSS
jgi:hypothetical protein